MKPFDLIPIFSYLLSRGKCRHCNSRVSLVYPLGELATGLLFVWIYLNFGNSWETLIGLLLVSLSVIITVSDLKYMLIPNRILLAFAPLFLVLRFLYPMESVWLHFWGAIAGGGVLLFIVVITRGGMGLGDVKLFCLLGWVLGLYNIIPAFLIACLIGSVVGGVLLLFKLIKPKQPIPFGPFLLIGSLLSSAYGSTIINFYLSIFN
ncbi:leader peptidase (prepilin peptidase)/N-methyltransferase [Fontibacillus solani]|uniref:Leader peptidase (Prepilin peptidase)/N-methyltransferase n=1 Tax=Fontibacillus solani TaxID=1572857 RepID=A0A7W3XQ47_9BACL|nr:leader peptidase (prepilin peptidase)/N-methyltransferase [Fontibacillus solani]